MMLFGVGIFITMDSTSRGNATRLVWDGLAEDQKASIEITRKCCGWEKVSESPECKWKDNGSCGISIVTKQRELLVGLGAMFFSVAAVQLLLFAITSAMIGVIRRKNRELKALEEARNQRRASLNKEGVNTFKTINK